MKVIIFEDERHNSERLVQLLKNSGRQIEIVGLIASVAEGIKWAAHPHTADLLFMDIQLSDGNCFEIFSHNEIKTPIIFTTAYDNFALQAFKVNSVDYLLKPIDLNELKNALQKFEELRPTNKTPDIATLADEFLKRDSTRFIGRLNSQLIYVKAKEIAYLHFAKGTTFVTTVNNRQLPLDYSLDQIEKMLDRNLFFRINRQFIIHIDAIKKITTYYNNRLILELQPHIDVNVIISRERVGDFKNWLEGK